MRPIVRGKAARAVQGAARKLGVLGIVVLGACASNPFSSKYKGQAATERLPLGAHVPGSVHTFDSRPEATTYVAATVTRDPAGKVGLFPFVGTWFPLPGKFYGHFAASFNRDPNFNAYLMGIGRSFADGKVSVGAGGVLVNEQFTKELAAKFKLPYDTQVTLYTQPDNWNDTFTVNLRKQIWDLKEGSRLFAYIQGQTEPGHGKLGLTFEQGKIAFDTAYEEFLRAKSAQIGYGFGETGQHFIAVGIRDEEGSKPSVSITVNGTYYGAKLLDALFGRSKNQRSPRRINSKRKFREEKAGAKTRFSRQANRRRF